jgi:Rod binding domain-containing protein
MMSSLERAAGINGGKEAGSNLYGSMLVDAVADAISRAGGIGLASMLKHSLEPQLQRSTGLPKDAPPGVAVGAGTKSQVGSAYKELQNGEAASTLPQAHEGGPE